MAPIDTEPTQHSGKSVKKSDLLQRFTNGIDDHLREVRYLSYGLAVIGVIVIGRSVRLTKKFTSVGSVPATFISRHVRLHGTVQQVNNQGHLFIDHTPIFRPKILLPAPHEGQYLPVSLCGVELGEEGVVWLQDHICQRPVWFTLMTVNSKKQLECIVSVRKNVFRWSCVNSDIVRQGLAAVQHVESLSHDPTFLQLSQQLGILQQKASQRRLGMWTRMPFRDRVQEIYQHKKNQAFQSVKEKIKKLGSFFAPKQ